MQELLRNVSTGWSEYTAQGKFLALLLCALLYLWFHMLQGKKKRNINLLLYTSLMTLGCVFPVTAAALMLYQRHYYNYVWIWSMIPITGVIAWAGCIFLTDCVEQYAGKERKKLVGICAFVLAIVMLSGNAGIPDEEITTARLQREEAYAVLSELVQKGNNETIQLWAPQSIMENARAYDSEIILPYGRNMWDPMLGTYTYDSYSLEIQQLYQWMLEVEQGSVPEDISCVEYALEKGVNCILLPGESDEVLRNSVETLLGVRGQLLGNYYVFNL